MAKSSQRALLQMLATLDQVESGVEQIHAACLKTSLERYADMLREHTWEMRAAVEAALKPDADG